MSRVLGLLVLSLALVSCAVEKPAGDYTARAETLIQSGDRSGALDTLREGIYRHPESYELNMLMGRTVLEHYTDLTPHARSRYLARHYFRRARSLAPDSRSAHMARDEYERVKEMQRVAR